MTKFVVDNGKNLFESYDKQEIDAIAEQKANTSDVYNKAVIDAIESGLLESINATNEKFNDYYTKVYIDAYFAMKNGEYDELTAGFSKQLISKVRVSDSVPYLFRTSGGSLDIGNREFDKLIGGTVAFNQLLDVADLRETQTVNDVTATNNNDGTFTISGTANADGYIALSYGRQFIQNHVYFLGVGSGVKVSTGYLQDGFNVAKWGRDTGNGTVYLRLIDGTVYNTKLSVVKIDLTQMFGSTIADYIYSLESANAGAGVEWFRRLFPLPYYDYNAGELISVKTNLHKMVGFNAWDENWEAGSINSSGVDYGSNVAIRSVGYIPVIPNTAYYMRVLSYGLKIRFYDINKNFVVAPTWNANNPLYIVPENCYYLRFATQDGYGDEYKNDICINLSWDGERNGEYEPYKAEYYPLAQNLELRGIPKLDASNNLYYDGDEYESTGDVTRKYGVVDMGLLNWAYNGLFYVDISAMKPATTADERNKGVFCAIYAPSSNTTISADAMDEKSILRGNGYVAIKDTAYTDAATFKTAVYGKYLIYELTTTTAETVNGFTNPQFVDDFGTEQYIDERPVAVPVGHYTEYDQNLRAKLEMSPDSPANDGLFLMQHNNGVNSYIPYISPIPALPTTNGNYTLKCVVSGGVPALAWILDE